MDFITIYNNQCKLAQNVANLALSHGVAIKIRPQKIWIQIGRTSGQNDMAFCEGRRSARIYQQHVSWVVNVWRCGSLTEKVVEFVNCDDIGRVEHTRLARKRWWRHGFRCYGGMYDCVVAFAVHFHVVVRGLAVVFCTTKGPSTGAVFPSFNARNTTLFGRHCLRIRVVTSFQLPVEVSTIVLIFDEPRFRVILARIISFRELQRLVISTSWAR